MALVLEAVGATGVVQRTPVNAARVKIIAQQGFTYRLVEDTGARFDQTLSVKRDRNTLVIDGLPNEQVVELDGFFFNCVPSAPCVFVTTNIGGTANITPASEPVGALQNGTFMMFTKGQLASAVPVAPEAEYSPRSILLGLGILGGVGLAAGGGGGSKGGNDASANDTTPPAAPLLTSGNLTKEPRPLIAGTAEAGSTVIVSLDIDGNGIADVSYEALTDANGVWSINTATATPSALSMPAGGLPDGANVRVILRARDAANNISTQATTEILTIDRQPPAQTATITSYSDDEPGLTGTIANNGTSNDRTPALTGSISAPLATGDKIEVLRNGVVVGEATVNNTLWTFTDNIPADVSAAISFTVRATDALGNGGTQSAPLVINVDTAAPAAPTIATVAGDNIVNIPESQSPVVIAGTAEAGAAIRVRWGNRDFNTTAGVDGQWQVTVATNEIPGNGSHRADAFATDAAGNTSVAGSRVIGVVTGLPSAPTIDPIAGDSRINATEAGSAIVVSGLADPGNEVSLTWSGIAGTRTVTAAPDGTWSVTFSAVEIDGLPQGTSSLVASARDIAGNVRTAPTVSVDKDTVAPAQVVTIGSVIDDQPLATGSFASGATINDQTPTLSGTLSAPLASGESLRIFRGGTELGTVTNVSGTAWTFTDALASDGAQSYSARVVDAAGNLGPMSAAFGLTLDSTAPAVTTTITAISDNVAPLTGTVANGGASNDGTPTLSGTLSGAVSGSDTVRISRNGVEIGTTTATGSTWTFTDSSGGLASGTSYSYTARVSDSAGNLSTASSAYAFVFDTSTATPTLATVAGNDAVSQAEAGGPVVVSGTAEAGSSVAVTWGGTTLTTTATGGSFSVSFASGQIPADGSVSISAVATDAAGNVSTPATRAIVIDRVLPAVPTIGTVAGNDQVNGAERAAGVTISGTAESGSTVTVSWPVGSGNSQTTTAAGGAYSVTFSAAQIPLSGPTTVTVTSTDSGGNSASAPRAVIVATDPPTQTPTIASVNDNVAPLTGAVASGGSTNDPSPTLSGTLTSALDAGDVLRILRGGVELPGAATVTGTTWTYTDTTGTLSNGSGYTYTARVVDSDGNIGSLSNGYSINFDTSTATPTISTVAGDNRVNAVEAASSVIVSGTAEAGASVAVTWGGTTLNATATGGNYSATFSSAQVPADGTPAISVVATDSAGNVSASANSSITVDRVAPATPTIAATIAGNNVVDFAERTSGVTVTGSAETGSTVTVTWGSGTQTAVAAGGSYNVTFTGAQIPADGPSSISASAVDAAGNPSAGSGTRVVTIDTTSTFSGTGGADTLAVSSLIAANLGNPSSVLSGGGGVDVLSFGTSGLSLDLTAVGNSQVVSFERVDMGGSGSNTLTLNAGDVLAMGGSNLFTGAAWGSLANAPARVQVVIDGDAGDTLNASGGWVANAGTPTVLVSGVTYDVYNASSGGSLVQILVDNAITRNYT